MQSLKVLNLGFNDISGAILVHLKGSVFTYIAYTLTLQIMNHFIPVPVFLYIYKDLGALLSGRWFIL